MMTSSVVKKANIAGDDVCSLENSIQLSTRKEGIWNFRPMGDGRSGPGGPLLPVKNLTLNIGILNIEKIVRSVLTGFILRKLLFFCFY